ncbi:MAG: NADH-quinone oxidoreductase subunit N [Planctomycetes bacterium]|nr:NADH-quinone oxidoreductase subunit N [Planctomycetota bacterium]
MSAFLPMGPKIAVLMPEIIVFGGSVVVSILGLSKSRTIRKSVPMIAAFTLLAALAALATGYSNEAAEQAGVLMPGFNKIIKVIILVVGLGLVAIAVGHVDRRMEDAVARGVTAFDPIRVVRGEFHAFMLLSICGAMLIPGSPDLVWFFLALELTSLPTYIMVAMSRGTRRAQEAAVKYFFLGAMSTAIFLYGFALIYGSTGSLQLSTIREVFADQTARGGIDALGITGLIFCILGFCFKLAAAPMHFYAPDVYEGAANPVTGFLSFIPKMAGFSALAVLLSTVGWAGHAGLSTNGQVIAGLPAPILATLWMICALTMTLGNIGALLQKSVKRMLAYSSISHSGYMVLAIIAGPGLGFQSLLFYMISYGVTNLAIFGALSGLQKRGEDVESFEELSGIGRRYPGLASWLAIGSGSLMGMPPLVGFWAKLMLFMAGIEAGHTPLVIIAALNSAISVWYYLRLVGVPILSPPGTSSEGVLKGPSSWPRFAAAVAAVLVIVLPIFSSRILASSAGGDPARPLTTAKPKVKLPLHSSPTRL